MADVKPTREFLEKMLDNYMESLVAHDPKLVPLADNVKRTENSVRLEPGDGFWATASELPTYKLYICDPETSQIGFVGFMKENGFPVIITTRLKIENGKITEIEDIVVREGTEMPFDRKHLVTPRPEFLEALKPEEKVSREEMVRVSDLYFKALEDDDGDIVPLWDECNRYENSVQTTNNPEMFPPDPDKPPRPMDCRGQINSGSFAYITSIRPRRWTVVDEERGITFGTFPFHHRGVPITKEIPGYGITETIPAFQRPFTILISELFKVKNGKIREIEAIGTGVPYKKSSGWEEYEK